MTTPEASPAGPDWKPEDIPLESPMPHSPSMDNEEPELDSGEADIPPEGSDAKAG